MKIQQMLHFPLRGAGTGIYVDDLAKSLSKSGHEVRVLCCDHYPPEKRYDVDAVLFSNGENEDFDLDYDFPVFASHPVSKGKKFGELSQSQRQRYFRFFQEKIEQGISVFEPDIIHVHHGWIIASILAEFEIPYVITLHGTEYYAFEKYKEYQELTLRGIHGAQIIMALTEHEAEQAVSAYRIDPRKITIVKSGTDTGVFKPLEIDKKNVLKSYSINDTDRPVVFFGGRLTAQKGIDTLIKAAGIYSREDKGPITLIAGDGDLRGQLQALAKQLELNSIYFLGNQDHRQMVKLFNIADVVALPSVFEPFGLIAIEALACGTPVIASKVDGFKHTVNEQIGCLIEPGDYKALAEKVTNFIRNGFKEKITDKATAYVGQDFSWEKTVSNIVRVYQRALEDFQEEAG
ncbi:MAG: glycosyltransferase family 4 protein [Planctomycetota bacterium]|jgi:glycosyltransferase involved in cell wall biosynthesis